MTRFIHDQFAKDYLEELLKSYGKVEAPSRVAGEVSPFGEVKSQKSKVRTTKINLGAVKYRRSISCTTWINQTYFFIFHK